ncbi:MAG: NAD(P)H-dependent glycerol-3-phosphate dehydrogenase [Saprospiraceae bacterium]|nr:NAD(P)H-dependent glycerol-3-phosphate dehydrogenase [Saprospiraceae bacterium]
MTEQQSESVGVIGAGNFGQTIARLLSRNVRVLLYSRAPLAPSVLQDLNSQHRNLIEGTQSIKEFCQRCKLIIPVVPSSSFRQVIRDFAAELHPFHIVIHATKGLDVVNVNLDKTSIKIAPSNIRTMSQVVRDETQVVRIGCISGPNLSAEIKKGLPAATVIASEYDEVITLGHQVLNSPEFKIYGSHDLIGTELAGALKNMIAIGTGITSGLKLGKNIEALLVTRGLREMLLIGNALGADPRTFFGTAGLGDLIATSTSMDSRNFKFGMLLGEGQSASEIQAHSDELVEGVRTIKLMYHFSQGAKLDVPIVEVLYGIIFKDLPILEGMSYLLDYPYSLDVDYIDFKSSPENQ